MNELEQNVIGRAKEWFYARKSEEAGAPINWTDINAEELETAVEELIQAEQQELILVFICF